MQKKRTKIVRFTKGEKLLYGCAIVALTCTFLIKIFCGAGVGHLNMSVEKLQYNINTQRKTNESLTMKINELTAFDNVKDLVKDMGLAYNNENVIIIGE
ncbi:MAG: hypothetical protein E7165_00195 [Firmicutes bacterium]|nr:hypothetical protein [Bacillota bacterium]